jgi:hypothetical protein
MPDRDRIDVERTAPQQGNHPVQDTWLILDQHDQRV